MALGAGSIGFVGFNADGNDNLAFVTFENIAAGTVITFTDKAWNGTAFTGGESTWTWTAGSDIAAGSIVTMDNLAAGLTATSNTGSIAYTEEGTRGLDADATDVVYAYIGNSTNPTFLTAISNGAAASTTNGTLANTGLTNGTNAVSFTTNANHDIMAYNGPRATGETLENLRGQIFTAANWATQNTAGDDSHDGVGPDAPFGDTPLAVDPNAQRVFFSADSLTVTHNEGDSGTTTFTFVIERSNGTTGDVTFSGSFARGDLAPADFPGNTLPTAAFTGTIAAGQTSTTVTITVVGDKVYEPLAQEKFTLVLKAASNNAATAYVDQGAADNTATGIVINDDTQQLVGFTANSLTVVTAEGDSGATTVTFTIERSGDGGTAGDVMFSGSFVASSVNAADFGGTLPTSFSGVIPAGQSSVTVTITVTGDTTAEGNEFYSLLLSSVSNSAGQNTVLNSGARQATGWIINDDGPSVVHAGETFAQIGLTGDTSLTIEQGGTVQGISVIGDDFDVTINNAGRFAFDGAGFVYPNGNGKITFNNQATGEVSGINVPKYAAEDSLDFVFNNAGKSGAINAKQNTTYHSIEINNLAGGVIDTGTTKTNGITVISNATINNAGKIIAPSNDGPREGIEYSGKDVVVNNLAGGWIEGGHHGVTGLGTVTVTNEAGGTMIGRNGSAVNIDNSFAGGAVVTIVNRGLMQGMSANSIDSDGDAIDTDGPATIENWGTIEGLGHSGSHNGGLNVSEGIALGGGSITNHAGGLIAGYGRGIQVDDSSEGGAFTAVTIVNDGTIRGYGNLPLRYTGSNPLFAVEEAYAPNMIGGEAINIIGTHADRLTNGATGQIIGGVKTGGGDDVVINKGSMTATGGSAVNLQDGNDTFEAYVGSHVSGLIDGGVGIDLINFAAAEAVEIDLAGGTVVRGAVSEVIANFENVIGSQHDDVITGSSVSNVLQGGAGEDRIDGAAGNDTLSGDAGDDLILGGAGDDHIDGGADDDVIFGDAGHDILVGGLGNDVIKGGEGDDTFVILATGDGRDSYDGGAGIDTLDYSALNTAVNLTLKDSATTFQTDTIENVENIIGGSAGDKLTGNALDNVLSGNAGDDTLNGGDGNDTLNGGEGLDTLNGGNGNDALNGGANDDVLKGVAGNDTLDGGEGNDDLDGGADNDTLLGGAGNDIVNGGAGNDVITGGAGNDTLTGGAGNDIFVFNSVSDGIDTITDFKTSGASEDRIQLSASMFQNFSGDDAFDLIGSGFLRALSSNGTTQIQVDVDGGGDHFVTLATVTGNISNGVLADHVLVQQDQMV